MPIEWHRALRMVRELPLRRLRRHLFVRSRARVPRLGAGMSPAPRPRVLVLGVYLADREHTAAHLCAAFAESPGIDVEQRWISLRGSATDIRLATATVHVNAEPANKFTLLNRLLKPGDIARFDFIVISDDDIYVQRDFLPALLRYQQGFDFAVAQPARSWKSHFDHPFVLRRPWLRARQTQFVECGPLVSFRRDAAERLLPFDADAQMWGLDLMWPALMREAGLRMGILDALTVDHSIRPQAATYDKAQQLEAMWSFLEQRPHLTLEQALSVVKRYTLGAALRP